MLHCLETLVNAFPDDFFCLCNNYTVVTQLLQRMQTSFLSVLLLLSRGRIFVALSNILFLTIQFFLPQIMAIRNAACYGVINSLGKINNCSPLPTQVLSIYNMIVFKDILHVWIGGNLWTIPHIPHWCFTVQWGKWR